MSRLVSVSETGQNLRKPTSWQRREAESLDAGRKAVEKPLEEVIAENLAKYGFSENIESAPALKPRPNRPLTH
jgi:hypothetical protein